MRVTIFFRKPRPGAQSIEELFDTILQVFGDTSNYQKVHMPYVKANLMGIAGNLRHCWEYRNGLCHITILVILSTILNVAFNKKKEQQAANSE